MLIGITGGIGSGKSVVSRICETLGYTVYDCDHRAKCIMAESDHIKTELCRIVGNDVLTDDGCIDRQHLASCIFGNDLLRHEVNCLVHSTVREDIQRVYAALGPRSTMFVESAIMRTSSLDAMMDCIWIVSAPEDICVSRVQTRNGLDENHIRQRMHTQTHEYTDLRCSDVRYINNDGTHSLLIQVNGLLQVNAYLKQRN